MCLSDYLVQKNIGSGTFGRVYLAQSKDGKEGLVALKIIDPVYTARGATIINKEFSLGQRIGQVCPQTVRYLRIFLTRLPRNPLYPEEWSEKACLVIVMSYLPGLSMERYVQHNFKHHKTIPPETCLAFLIQTSQIVQSLHRSNFIHGDLNLGNILLANHQYHLIDLGGAGDLSVTDSSRPECVRLDKIVTGPIYMLPSLYRRISDDRQYFVQHPVDHTNVVNYMKANDVYALLVSGLVLLHSAFLMQPEAQTVLIKEPAAVPKMFDHYRRIHLHHPLTDRLLSLIISLYQRFHSDESFYLGIDELVNRLISLV